MRSFPLREQERPHAPGCPAQKTARAITPSLKAEPSPFAPAEFACVSSMDAIPTVINARIDAASPLPDHFRPLYLVLRALRI